ncbi:MAG: tetratricopeptide repeat protein, partial [Candidatus Atribacteria bacterium]|nr:tetratricopeptide repeat protein [Candidatus Atribacteria bacterium]
MLIKLYPIKRTLAVYIVILFLTLFLSIIPIFAQQSDDPLEKQLKVFQLSNLLDTQSNFPQQDAYFKNALQYFQNKHYSFAIQELEKIGYSHLYIPLYLKSQLLKGKCYETLNRWESALYIYEKIIEDVPIMRDYVLFLLGKIYLHMNDFSNAMIIFQRLKNEYP